MAIIGTPTFKNGYGYGDGYGYSYGSGDGYGDGDGDGYGYGSGSGSGYSYGSGYGFYWLQTIDWFSRKWMPQQCARFKTLKKRGAKIAFWCSDAKGRACNGGNNKPVDPGTIETSDGPLQLCGPGTLHATLEPTKWEGDRWWIVALLGDVIGDEEKFGALKREIIGECL